MASREAQVANTMYIRIATLLVVVACAGQKAKGKQQPVYPAREINGTATAKETPERLKQSAEPGQPGRDWRNSYGTIGAELAKGSIGGASGEGDQ